MTTMNRRTFLDRSKASALSLGAGLTILNNPKSIRAEPASDKIVMAIVGCRGRGPALARGFASRDDCEIGYICDVDMTMIDKHTQGIADCQGGKTPKGEQDFRKMLDDKSVDAIVIATPTHWHAPATVWGCQAGKDVYVDPKTQHVDDAEAMKFFKREEMRKPWVIEEEV